MKTTGILRAFSQWLVTDDRHSCLSDLVAQPEGIFNTPVRLTDLYTPRWVKGIGRTKQGMCPICAEDTSRGGLGVAVWLAMKQSAYKYASAIHVPCRIINLRFSYHMLYKHGASLYTSDAATIDE